MINMMYLVLTALLALNVTKEVINAFVTINESVTLSKENVIKKNQATYAAFEQAMSVDKAKYQEVYDKANQVKKGADDVANYIEGLKTELVRAVDDLKDGEPTPALPDMEAKDNYDIPTNILCGDDQQGIGAKASELKKEVGSIQEPDYTKCS